MLDFVFRGRTINDFLQNRQLTFLLCILHTSFFTSSLLQNRYPSLDWNSRDKFLSYGFQKCWEVDQATIRVKDLRTCKGQRT